MFLYRHYLLEDFLRKMPRESLEAGGHQRTVGRPPENVQKCVDAALRVAETAADLRDNPMYNAVFWVRFPTLQAISMD
jgi:hypothetical protein